MSGKILAVKLRNQLRFFIEDDHFGPMIPPEIAAERAEISPRHIERRLVEARNKLQIKGKNTTNRGS